MTLPLSIPRVNVLGVGISAVNPETAVQSACDAVHEGRKGYVCVTGVHGVMEGQRDPGLRAIHNQSILTVPDGMPMVWLGRYHGHKTMRRVYGPDLMLALCRASVPLGFTHYLYGGAPGVAEALKQNLENRVPGLRVVGTCTPPFRELHADETDNLRRELERLKPDILWVGISTPRQERFMAAMIDTLNVRLMLGVGAAFDFHTGRVRQAPGWMQRAGLEWLFRLAMEPRRLWRRYFRNNPAFVILALSQVLGLRRYDLAPMEKENHEH